MFLVGAGRNLWQTTTAAWLAAVQGVMMQQ